MLILEAERGTKETGFVLTGGRWLIVTKEEGRRRGTPLTEETFGEAFKYLFGIVAGISQSSLPTQQPR
jgi:hypothetical protein